MELRSYQIAAKAAIEAEWEAGRKRTLLVLPTGTGKTIVFAKIAEDVARRGERVLILAHRGELLEQAADKLQVATGILSATEKADQYAHGSYLSVVVGSVQSLMREGRLAHYTRDAFSTIIVDEAHHVLSDSYQKVLSYFRDARVLGVTATADRGDKRDLGQYFDSLAYEYTLPAAISEGYLSRIEAQTIPLELDISQVGISSGDFAAGELGCALDPYLERIAEEMVAAGCRERRSVVFLPLIDTSKKMRDVLRVHGFAAEEVNGASTDRAEILKHFASGQTNVICNSMLLTEGWDCPEVDCIVVLRPTKVRALYAQMVGRGTRIAPGKDALLLLDFLWHTERHDLCHPAHLIATSADVADTMTRSIAAAGCPVELTGAEVKASKDVIAEREQALARQLKDMKKRKRKLVDPLQFELSIAAEDLASYTPSFGWEMSPPSEKQLKTLEKYGIFSDEVECAGKASKLLDRLASRRAQGLSTPKQIRFLEGRGFQHVGMWGFEDATHMINRIAANSWRTPSTIDPYTYQAQEGLTYA